MHLAKDMALLKMYQRIPVNGRVPLWWTYWNAWTIWGDTVNFKTHRKSYKQKKKIENDKSEWKIFENTHEPIIDQSTFDIVQKIRANRKRPTKMGEMPMFSGILYCADCGKKLSFHRRANDPDTKHKFCVQ